MDLNIAYNNRRVREPPRKRHVLEICFDAYASAEKPIQKLLYAKRYCGNAGRLFGFSLSVLMILDVVL